MPFGVHFCINNPLWNEKGDFVKMSVSRKRELDFVVYGVPETFQKASQKRFEKVWISWAEKTMKNDVKSVPKRHPNHSKHTSENSLENQVKKRLKKHEAKAPGCTRKVGGISRRKFRAGGCPFSYIQAVKTQRPQASRKSLIKSMSRQKQSGLEARRRAEARWRTFIASPAYPHGWDFQKGGVTRSE